MVTYFEIGRLLNEAGSIYGENIIGQFSEMLMNEVGKKYNKRTLFRMRQFYVVFSSEKVSPLATQLSWSHYTELLPIKDVNEMLYYLNISISQNLTKRDLRNKIKNNEYERLPAETKNKLINKEKTKAKDLVKNPNNYEVISEKILQKLILENLTSFLKELVNNFSFISNEYKIKIGSTYNYIDLLLYNIEFNCYVVIELKVTELKKEHIGQIEVYMNYVDKNVKKGTQDKTIGIIICKKDNKFIMEYCSDNRIITKEYELV